MSRRAYYFNSITNFILEDEESVLGQLLINDEFETTDLQKMAWRSEIQILKEQLVDFSQGDIIFEYTIPRMGHRVDAVSYTHLIVTARNKMRTATDLTCPVTVSGNLLETPRLKASKNILASNEIAFKNFVNSLSSIGDRFFDEERTKGHYYWKNVPGDNVCLLYTSGC